MAGAAFKYVSPIPRYRPLTPSLRTMAAIFRTTPRFPDDGRACSRRRTTSSGYVTVCAKEPAVAPDMRLVRTGCDSSSFCTVGEEQWSGGCDKKNG